MRSKLSVTLAVAGTVLLVAVAAGTVVSVAGGLNPKALFAQNNAQQQQAAARAVKPANKSDHPLPAPSSAKATRISGIQDIQQGPVSSSEFAVNNQWSGPETAGSDTWWQVYAGAKGGQGGAIGAAAIYVETSTPTADGYSFQTAFVGIFAAPSADSSLTITAVNGSVVDMQTQTGRVYHFNLATDKYQ